MEDVSLTRLDIENKRTAELRLRLARDHPDLVGRKLGSEELGELAQRLPLCKEFQLEERLYGIVAYSIRGEVHSFVFGEKQCHNLDQTTKGAIDMLIRQLYGVDDHAMMTKVIAEVFKRKGIKRFPFPHRHYTLMPLGPINDPETAWVNPAHIEEFIQVEGGSLIRCTFDLILPSRILTLEALEERMRIAFMIHGLFRRDKSRPPMQPHQELKDYLGLRSSEVVDHALKGMTVEDIPGKYGDLREFGREIWHGELLRQEEEKRGKDDESKEE